MKFARILALVALMFCAMIALAFIFSGCNVNKHITKTSIDSATVKKVDSASVNTSDLNKSEGSSTGDSSSIDVELVGGDSSTWTPKWVYRDTVKDKGFIKNSNSDGNSVTIQPNKEGGYTVTSNTPIKSIKIKDSKTTEQHKTSDSAVTKVNTIHTSDSTHLVKQVAVKDIVKKSGFGLLDWIGLAVLVGIIVYISAKIYLYFNPEATGVFALLAGWRRKKEQS